MLASILSFSVPLLIGSLLQTLYNTVDSIFVGNFASTEALAAVGACQSPMMILLSVMLGLSSGVSVLMSQVFGSGDADKIEEVVATANGFFLVSVVPITVCTLLLVGPLLEIINIPSAAREYAYQYLLIVFGGLIGSYGYNLNSGILRGLGDSRSPLLFLLVACSINIILDLIFVGVFGWGVPGVAIATVIAQVASWLYSIWHIRRHYEHIHYRLFFFRVNRVYLKKILSLSLPMVMNHAVFSLGFLLYYRFVNGLGPAFMAGYAIAGKLENLTWQPVSSLGTAAVAFSGQNSGAGNIESLNKGVRLFLKTAIIINVAAAAITLLLGRYMLGIFSSDAAVIEAGYGYLTVLLPFYWIYAIVHILASFMNGAGDVKIPTFNTMLMFWGIRLPVAWYMSLHFAGNLLHIAYPASWVVGCILTVAYFRTGRWKRRVFVKPVTAQAVNEAAETNAE